MNWCTIQTDGYVFFLHRIDMLATERLLWFETFFPLYLNYLLTVQWNFVLFTYSLKYNTFWNKGSIINFNNVYFMWSSHCIILCVRKIIIVEILCNIYCCLPLDCCKYTFHTLKKVHKIYSSKYYSLKSANYLFNMAWSLHQKQLLKLIALPSS